MTVHPSLYHPNDALQLCRSGSPVPRTHCSSFSTQKCILQQVGEKLLSHFPGSSCPIVEMRCLSHGLTSLPELQAKSILLMSFIKEPSESNKKLRKLSWWPNMDSQVEGYKILYYLPDVLTKCIIILNQISFWTPCRRGIASGEKHYFKEIQMKHNRFLRSLELKSCGQVWTRYLCARLGSILKIYTQIPDQKEESSGIHLP